MRFTKSDLHPVIFEAVNTWHDAMIASMTTTGWTKGTQKKVYDDHQVAWWKHYGVKLLWGMAGWSTAIAAPIMVAAATHEKLIALGSVVMTLGATGHGIYAYMENRKQITIDELKVLHPALEMEPLHHSYCDAFIDLYSNPSLEEGHRKEILGQLNTLIDEDLRLRAQKKNLSENLATEDYRVKVDAEIARLTERVAASRDEVARKTLETSLEIAQKRRDRLGASEPMIERLDAQMELVAQTMDSMREVLIKMRNAPRFEESDVDTLRSRVAQVQQQGQALESAYDEIQSLT
ncbi:MAG: hypothetical protein IT206_07085 [Fimbriimonadaceae bacterium]|nr:hypothetical protein [Fimbriimonadaceae bacterium]